MFYLITTKYFFYKRYKWMNSSCEIYLYNLNFSLLHIHKIIMSDLLLYRFIKLRIIICFLSWNRKRPSDGRRCPFSGPSLGCTWWIRDPSMLAPSSTSITIQGGIPKNRNEVIAVREREEPTIHELCICRRSA